MIHDDLKRLSELDIDFESISLLWVGEESEPYFCTPVGAEYVGWLGVDGIHYVRLPGDERIFCVNPAMGEAGTFVLPVSRTLREFLSFVLYCKSAFHLSELYWQEESDFRDGLDDEEDDDLIATALDAIAEAFDLTPADPYDTVKAMQAEFDPSALIFSDEYYDTLGLARE